MGRAGESNKLPGRFRAAQRSRKLAPRPSRWCRRRKGSAADQSWLRARAALFAGDDFALDASRTKLREEFTNQRDASDPAEIAELLRGAAEVEDLLRENVVQGRLNERGNYAFKVKGESSADELDHRAEPVDELELRLAEAELAKKGEGT